MAAHNPPARTNLPIEPNRFIGREHDLAELRALVETHRVVTVCGMGGIGKTRLALRVAALTVSGFPDGVWVAGLDDLSTRDMVVTRIASVLGITATDGRRREWELVEALRDRTLLLVLDNCEHVIFEVADVCRNLLAWCPSLTLLITSREPARIGGEVVWRLAPLGVAAPEEIDVGEAGHDARGTATFPVTAEAERLFVARARAADHGFAVTRERAPLISRICRRLEGIPLAIELAAARVPVLSLSQILERLNDRFQLLTLGSRSAPVRQQTLRSAIDWSHFLLSEAEQVLLRRLSVFATWDLELAERVCSDSRAPKAEILDLLSSLVDRSLVTLTGESWGRARYRMLDTVRHYATERLREADEERRFRDRHRRHAFLLAGRFARACVAGPEISWDERVETWQRVAAEYENLRLALHRCYQHREIEHGVGLCVALLPYWFVCGHLAEGRLWTDLFLAHQCDDPHLLGRAMVGRAWLAVAASDHQGADRLAAEGLSRCRAAGDDRSAALALMALAADDIRSHEHTRARERLSEAVGLSNACGDRWGEGMARGAQGALAARQGDLPAARRYYRAALSLMRDIDHRWGIGSMLAGEGLVAEREGDLHGAERHYREAIESQRDIHAPPELARCFAGLARVLARRGEEARARDHLIESLTLSHRTGQPLGIARGIAGVADLAARQGAEDVAHRLAGAAAALRERSGVAGPAHPPLHAPVHDEPVSPPAADRWREGRELDPAEGVRQALRFATTGLAGESGGAAEAPASRPAESSLTAREREIATQIGAGLGNREIAEKLFISPATVARHVANIHTKLGFHSRSQIAAWISGREDAGER